MSDYAGTILTVVGYAVSAMGYPYIGAAISAAGVGLNAYQASQQVIPGPKIGDVQKQVATEGAPIPIVYGYSPPIMGTVVADAPPRIIPEQQGGKGGPKQGKGETALRTYAIMFCEGESTLRQAWRNGILVYNADDPGMSADNAKFLEYAAWLTGSFDQMPHPALQAIYGAGNAPAFRGRSVLVLDQEDVTDMRGMRSQWHVRVFRGAAKSYTTPPYPILQVEALDIAFAPTGGQLDTLMLETFALDELDIGFAPTGGDLREPIIAITTEAGELDIGMVPTGGELRAPMVGASVAPNAVDVGLSPTGGSLTDIWVPATVAGNETDIAFAPTGGSLS